MTEWIIASSLGFGIGGAVVWFFKPHIMLFVMDANAVAAKLHAAADKIKGAA